MCFYPERRAQMVREVLVGRAYQLPEEIGDGCLGERAPGVPDREEKVSRPRRRPCPMKIPMKGSNWTEETFVII